MTQLQAIRKFANYVAQKHVIIYRSEDDDYESDVRCPKPRIGIPADVMKKDERDRLYREYFTSICPMGRGFADITISILHEIGHHFNREIFLFDTDEEEYKEAYGYDHFNFPCEKVATEWAIEWLKDPEHRKVAKRFEKDFFGY